VRGGITLIMGVILLKYETEFMKCPASVRRGLLRSFCAVANYSMGVILNSMRYCSPA
jgi:hypothetical protein